MDTRFDSRDSFYGKAITKAYPNGKVVLLSYLTEVAYIEKGEAVVNGDYSATTLRHIKEFLKQNGFKADNKKQIFADYFEVQND